MSIKVYHQLGFREKWNIDVYNQYKIGDGFIFSPVNLEQSKLQKISKELKQISFLDPQCYFPDQVSKGKLSTYDYFPQNVAKVSACATIDFNKDGNKEKIAELCLGFQLENDFEYVVIPFNKSFVQNPHDIIEKNHEKFIWPFINEYKNKKCEKEMLLTIVVDDTQLRFEDIRDYLLTWITGISQISGVYLIFQVESTTKQIKNFSFLLSALKFVDALKQNGLKIIIGYTNTEALLYSVAMPDAVTMGSYENLRKFSVNRFIENDVMARAPIARLYSAPLLNWIPAGTINSIREKSLANFDKLFDKNEERPYNLSNEFNWHFTKPELYKHYFISFYNQIKGFPEEPKERIDYLTKMIDNALEEYKSTDVPFDSESNQEHLIVWKEVLDEYVKYKAGKF